MIKKIITALSLGFLLCITTQAQTVQDIFSNYKIPVTWFGIDYSHSKIIGTISSFGGKSPISAQELRDGYYWSWNNLLLSEPEKYNVESMIHRVTVIKDLSLVKQLNADASLDSIEAPVTPFYTPIKIQQFVSNYSIEGMSGIGLIFIAESMNKITSTACYHVVFFNIETKEVLLQQRLNSMAGGVGLRNFWASSFCKLMAHIRDDSYYKWQKEYGKGDHSKSKAAPGW